MQNEQQLLDYFHAIEFFYLKFNPLRPAKYTKPKTAYTLPPQIRD